MTDRTYESIVAALERLATGTGSRTNGKISAVNLATEAGIGKATLYRYFKDKEQLRIDYEATRKRGVGSIPEGPATLEEAVTDAQVEIRELRSELASAEVANKAKAHQLFLLWTENKSLHRELARAADISNRADNVTPFPRPKH